MYRTLFIRLFFCLPVVSFSQLKAVRSHLEIFDVEKMERKQIYTEEAHFEAPNWSKDGQYLILNSYGKLFRLNLKNNKKTWIDTAFADQLNNDHGISPDGTQIVISHYDKSKDTSAALDYTTSRIYILPIDGGTPKAITKKTPSFWHGWSPDGKTLIYTALRNNDFDIYAISVNGGEEIQLTNEAGLDDGSDYSPDGNFIYYNSMQSGNMEIWRMDANGNNKKRFTNDAFSNWFPHPSPDGKKLVFLSYLKDQGSSHPPMKAVALRLYNLEDHTVKTLCSFTGGQGTINVPSWSPDSSQFAFVSYSALKD